jgi:putative copper export protein
VAQGEIVFGVGAAPAAEAVAALGDDRGRGLPVGSPAAKLLWYAGLALLGGGLWLGRAAAAPEGLVARCLALGLGVAAAGALARGLTIVASVVAGAEGAGSLAGRLLDGYTTSSATPWWLAAGVGAFVLDSWRRGRRPHEAALVVCLAGGIGLAATTGHETTGGLALLVQGLHVLGAIGWIGPLAAITVALAARTDRIVVRHLLFRYAPLAAWSFVALAATGVHLAWTRGGADLLDTSYGWTLVAKVSVVAYVLVPLGWHHHRSTRRAATSGAAPGPGFARTARVELAAMVVVLAIAVVLGGLDPTGRSAAPAAAAPAPAPAADDCASLPIGRVACYEAQFLDVLRRDGAEAAVAAIEATAQRDEEVRSDCHRLTHVVGRTAAGLYDTVGEAFSFEASACWSGYYHGYLEEALAPYDDGELKAALPHLCDDARSPIYGFTHYNCVHGLGHGLLIRADADLFATLAACERLPDQWEVDACAGGAFMQNVVNAQEGSAAAVRDDDPLYPCSAVGDRHRPTCYLMQTSYVLWQNGYDYSAAFKLCDGVAETYRDDCYQSMGRDISGVFLFDPDKVVSTCRLGSADGLGDCYIGAALNAVYNDHDTEAATALCETVEERHREACRAASDEAASSF